MGQVKNVRKARHWKEHLDPRRQMVWRKPVLWEGRRVQIGEALPTGLGVQKTRHLWERGFIGFLETGAPTKPPKVPPAPPVAPDLPAPVPTPPPAVEGIAPTGSASLSVQAIADGAGVVGEVPKPPEGA